MTNCQTISVPSSTVIKGGTTINPVTKSSAHPPPLLLSLLVFLRNQGLEYSGTTTEGIVAERTQFLAIRCGITGSQSMRERYYASRESTYLNRVFETYNLILVVTLAFCMD